MTNSPLHPNKKFLTFLALFVVPISGISIDIYVPSLPAVSHYFNVDKTFAQLTVTAYMLGLGLMQLFAGPVSDSFGRKKPVVVAMLIYVLVSFLIPATQNIYQLFFLRFVQGTAVAMTVVPMRSVASDLFQGHELYKVMNYMTMAWSIGPIIAPAMGGYLQHYMGWQANFYFLAFYSLLAFLLVTFCLPETSAHRHPFQLLPILQRYRQILFHREYVRGLLINGALYSIVISFAVISSFLIQNVMHYTSIEFGHVALLSGLSWFLGAMTNHFIIKVPLAVKSKICFLSMLVLVLFALILACTTPLTIYRVVLPVYLLLWLGGIVFPNNFAVAMSLFPKTTGSANALFGAFIFLISGVSSSAAAFLKSDSEIPLLLAFLVIISFCLVVNSIKRT